MIHVAMATATIRMKRIVYADGRCRPRRAGSASTAGAAAVIPGPPMSAGAVVRRPDGRDVDACPALAGDHEADLSQAPDRRWVAGALGECDPGLDLGPHGACRQVEVSDLLWRR